MRWLLVHVGPAICVILGYAVLLMLLYSAGHVWLKACWKIIIGDKVSKWISFGSMAVCGVSIEHEKTIEGPEMQLDHCSDLKHDFIEVWSYEE